jgi:enoyl-[acyl-carrier-protein] reductase (NADH)
MTLEAEFDASPERMWQLWADPRQLERWCGPPTYLATFTTESITGDFEGRDAIVGDIVKSTMLNRAATLEDVGNVAAFVASDKARSMTAATANVSCGN